MEGLSKQCVERFCELANKKTEQLYRVSTPCLDDQTLLLTLESLNQLWEEFYVSSEVRPTFLSFSWMCKKQNSVSHSSTESEVVSLDAGLHMDCIPALDLWDLVIEVLHSSQKLSSIGNRIAQ